MLNITGGEIMIILFAALIVLGPDRLPDVARSAGEMYSKVRKMASSLQSEVQEVLDDPAMKPIREVGEFVAQPRKKLSDLAQQADLAASAQPPTSPADPAPVDPVAESADAAPDDRDDRDSEPDSDESASLGNDEGPDPGSSIET